MSSTLSAWLKSCRSLSLSLSLSLPGGEQGAVHPPAPRASAHPRFVDVFGVPLCVFATGGLAGLSHPLSLSLACLLARGLGPRPRPEGQPHNGSRLSLFLSSGLWEGEVRSLFFHTVKSRQEPLPTPRASAPCPPLSQVKLSLSLFLSAGLWVSSSTQPKEEQSLPPARKRALQVGVSLSLSLSLRAMGFGAGQAPPPARERAAAVLGSLSLSLSCLLARGLGVVTPRPTPQ